MMKRNILAVIVPALLVAGTANAAEIYNKDGNKVDQLLVCIIFPRVTVKTVTVAMAT